MDERVLEVPNLDYFESGNDYVGSHRGFNYRIWPQEGQLFAEVWYGYFCRAKSAVEGEQSFPLDEEGRTALEGWLKEADAAFAEKKEAGELEEKLRI